MRTTDEWTEDFYPEFARDVDTHIKMLTSLRGDKAYTLRRMIMMSLRNGPANSQKLTAKIDELRERLNANL